MQMVDLSLHFSSSAMTFNIKILLIWKEIMDNL